MPRIRTIKPEICSDEKLASVSRESRLTFVLSITQADDDGLLAGNTRQLLAALYPLDDGVTPSMVELWRRELVQAGLWTQRYTLQGSSVVEITNWDRHQRIDKKGKSIILPTLASVSRESRESVASVSRSDPHTPDPHTPIPPTPDRGVNISQHMSTARQHKSTYVNKNQHASTHTEAEAETETETEKTTTLARKKLSDDPFSQIWAIYPRRAGSNPRKAAYTAFYARVREGVGVGSLGEAVARYATFCEATGKVGTEFVQQGQRFFGPDGGWRELWITPAAPVHMDKLTAGRAALADWLASQDAPSATAIGEGLT